MTAKTFQLISSVAAAGQIAGAGLFQPGMYFSFSIQQTVYFNSPLEFPTSVGIERKFLIRIEFQKKPHLA
jgi:hypothetical protein